MRGCYFMNFKLLTILGLILLTLCSITAIHADTYVIGNTSFSLDDGYALSEKGNNIMLYNDDYVITLSEIPYANNSGLKRTLIKMGYNFIGERNYTFDGVKINQQNYNNDGVNTCVYSFKKNGHNYVISLNLLENKTIPEYEDNPVTQIIDTMQVEH